MRLGFPDSISDQSRTAGRGQTAVQRYPLQKMENLEQKQPRIIGGTSVRPSSSEVTMKFDDAMPEQMMEGVNTKTTADSVLQRAALMVCESRCPANQNQVFSSSVPSSNSPQNIAVPNKTATGYTQGEHFPQVDQRKRFNHQCSTENSECVGNYHRLCAMRSILSSNAPLIVEVWLFADCCCNFTSEQLNWENLCCDAVLIEVWTFQKIVKRCGESVSGTLDANALFQAIRSHLSFSQLASWLVSSRGQSPSSIHYRLCPGGDVLSPSSKVTQRSFHFHSFPSCVPQPKSEFLLSAQVHFLKRDIYPNGAPNIKCKLHSNNYTDSGIQDTDYLASSPDTSTLKSRGAAPRHHDSWSKSEESVLKNKLKEKIQQSQSQPREASCSSDLSSSPESVICGIIPDSKRPYERPSEMVKPIQPVRKKESSQSPKWYDKPQILTDRNNEKKEASTGADSKTVKIDPSTKLRGGFASFNSKFRGGKNGNKKPFGKLFGGFSTKLGSGSGDVGHNDVMQCENVGVDEVIGLEEDEGSDVGGESDNSSLSDYQDYLSETLRFNRNQQWKESSEIEDIISKSDEVSSSKEQSPKPRRGDPAILVSKMERDVVSPVNLELECSLENLCLQFQMQSLSSHSLSTGDAPLLDNDDERPVTSSTCYSDEGFALSNQLRDVIMAKKVSEDQRSDSESIPNLRGDESNTKRRLFTVDSNADLFADSDSVFENDNYDTLQAPERSKGHNKLSELFKDVKDEAGHVLKGNNSTSRESSAGAKENKFGDGNIYLCTAGNLNGANTTTKDDKNILSFGAQSIANDKTANVVVVTNNEQQLQSNVDLGNDGKSGAINTQFEVSVENKKVRDLEVNEKPVVVQERTSSVQRKAKDGSSVTRPPKASRNRSKLHKLSEKCRKTGKNDSDSHLEAVAQSAPQPEIDHLKLMTSQLQCLASQSSSAPKSPLVDCGKLAESDGERGGCGSEMSEENGVSVGEQYGLEVDASVIKRAFSYCSPNVVFNPSTGLPLSSSPVAFRRISKSISFHSKDGLLDFLDKEKGSQSGLLDQSPAKRPQNFGTEAEKNNLDTLMRKESDAKLPTSPDATGGLFRPRSFSNRSVPLGSSASSSSSSQLSLVVNFEESVLNGRMEPFGIIEGFKADIGAAGAKFCPQHATIDFSACYYNLSNDGSPSPYFGYISLQKLGKRGYRVPRRGQIQVTLFNPNGSVIKVFIVMYDLSEMPSNHQTFLRQRTFLVPKESRSKLPLNHNNSHTSRRSTGSISKSLVDKKNSVLKYLLHLRFQSSSGNKIYLHTDIRCIFSRSQGYDSATAGNKVDQSSFGNDFELKTFTEIPQNPQFSPSKP